MQELKPKNPIKLVDPPKHLFSEVILRVREDRQLLATRRRFFSYSVVLLASVVGLVPLVRSFVLGLSASGFTKFFSLLFSDSSVVLTNWQDYGYSLLESFPVTTLISVIGLVVVFLYSLQIVIQESKRTARSFRLANR